MLDRRILLILLALMSTVPSNDAGSTEANQPVLEGCSKVTARDSFEKNEILKDLRIEEINSSFEGLGVKFSGNLEVSCGNELTPTQAHGLPSEVTWTSSPDNLYTVIMVDPDATSRKNPTLREILHWMVVNVPGDDLSKGWTSATYRGPGPPPGSGLHRYIFLVFQQKPGHVMPQENMNDKRIKFHVMEFAKKNDLIGPIAGNFFQAQNESTT